MAQIIILTEHRENWSAFAEALAEKGKNEIEWHGSRDNMLSALTPPPPRLVIIDESVAGSDALQIARDVVMANALINVAVVGTRSHDDFHEASEGLGILAQLPPTPGVADAANLLQLLSEMPM